jgi:hypothetical protein
MYPFSKEKADETAFGKIVDIEASDKFIGIETRFHPLCRLKSTVD